MISKSADVRGNRLLRLLERSHCPKFPSLTPVELSAREVLIQPGMKAHYAHFPLTAVISLVSTMEDGASAEVALVGREGVLGLAGVFGGLESPATGIVQIAGTALRTTTDELRSARLVCPAFRDALDLYTKARLIQVAQTAACNRLHPVEARLARWVLAVHDRIDGDRFRVSHESIAQVLGVHRPTVTTALQRLQEAGAIGHDGRALVIADRARLEGHACECHEVVRRELDTLLGLDALNGEGPQPAVARPGSPANRDDAAVLEGLRQIAGRLLLASIAEQEVREAAEAAMLEKDRLLVSTARELGAALDAILRCCSVVADSADHSIAPAVEEIERAARAGRQLVDRLAEEGGVVTS